MQLLIRYEAHDTAAFRAAHDETRGDRDEAGLTQLQLWEEADVANRVWALYGVADRDRAEAWLARTSALASKVESVDAHFLATT